ncbi:hypothetical protein BDP81DRAFT_429880 [Colletotrichum phormii]|uniref:Uncharacterized protein n=1 Tax=Colletotrichum phormii TaxID=359342 RepID=A0AAJ0ED68_9PEZI|nr:uncharacterized protein BDP81DRAFT_429880 [Colletotrichum phormii]KAK1635557.1 hypothetical protein BDP81DRAFT_429880 [Colletotrichum phormii]
MNQSLRTAVGTLGILAYVSQAFLPQRQERISDRPACFYHRSSFPQVAFFPSQNSSYYSSSVSLQKWTAQVRGPM